MTKKVTNWIIRCGLYLDRLHSVGFNDSSDHVEDGFV